MTIFNMKVFINKRIPQIGLEILNQQNLQIISPENKIETHEEWLEYCKKADIILNVGNNKFDKFFLNNARMLKQSRYFQ